MLDRRPGGIGGIHCGSFVGREIKSTPQQQIVSEIAAPAGSSPVANWNALPLRLFDQRASILNAPLH
jgi:hypothetical protein